jgi:uncharacterized protein (DUF2141 family)
MRISTNPLTQIALCSLLAVAAVSLVAQAPATPPPAPAAPAATAPAAAPATTPALTSTVTVKVKGIRNAKGKIGVVLYGSSEGFPLDPSNAAARKQVDVDPKTMTATVVFDKLPQGTYAATVLHDENLVGKMEFDSQGMPLEGYGISNNPDSSSGPPSFDDSKFKVDQPDVVLEIAMVYWQ